MSCPVRALVRAVLPFALLVTAACAEPPSKEMNQAQGAIEAARAAGAERYATDEFKAATTALANSEQAVRDGDYRLALGYALDSRERAQNAAREAVDGRAAARGEAERLLAELTATVTHARARLDEPDAPRIPARVRREATATLANAERSLQEARAALERGEYEGVKTALDGQTAAIEERLKQIEAALQPPAARPRR